MIRHPQIEANELIVETEHRTAGRLRHTRNAARFSQTEPEHRFGAPLHGEHTREVLFEAGYSPEEVDALLTRRAAILEESGRTG